MGIGSEPVSVANPSGIGNIGGQHTTRMLANPLGIGGSRVTDFLSNPFGSNDAPKPKTLSYDANGNPLIGGLPYDPNKIYNNPKKAEAANKVRIQYGTGAVNSIFDDPARAKQRQDFLDAMREFYTGDANRQKQVADRNLKFSMARGGLTGGSANRDANVTLGEDYQKGLLDSENRAQGAFSDLQGQDEQTRLNLLSMVRSGLGTTDAAQRAGAAMQANAGAAKSAALTNGLGDVFGNTASIYKKQTDAAERRRGSIDAYGSVYGAKNPYGG